MPDFDGTGPLKRGRAIGRGMEPCKKSEGYVDGEQMRPVTHTEKTKPGYNGAGEYN
jgi:hypothetical protein